MANSDSTKDSGGTEGKRKEPRTRPNVGTAGRIASAVAGVGALGLGLYRATRHPWFTLIALLATPLLLRAITGRSLINRMLGVDTSEGEAAGG